MTTGSLLPSQDPCSPGAGNEPVEDAAYQCSVMVRLQPAIDRANRLTHALGERPYRVFLVWQARDARRQPQEVCRVELMPVRIVALDSVDLTLAESGLQPEGGITLREVSPAQVNEDQLRGYRDGAKWASEETGREFFYEVVTHVRCAGAPQTRRRRFVLAAEPHLDGGAGEFRVQLVDQEIARSPDGVDRTRPPMPFGGPKLVT